MIGKTFRIPNLKCTTNLLVRYVFKRQEETNEGDGEGSMRDLLLAEATQRVRDVMIERPFALRAMEPVRDIMPLVHIRHYSEYPVCKDEGHLVGIVRDSDRWAPLVICASAHEGPTRLKVNLLGSFVAAGLVGFYEDAVTQAVAVAAFIPVMVGQSASTGGQALSVALRGLTIGELGLNRWHVLIKEAVVGTVNGALVGLTAGLGIYFYATFHGHPGAVKLAGVMLLAMIFSTTVSSVVGAVTPFLLKRLGFDPAIADHSCWGITRIVSIAAFLALTRWIVL
jgi:magnesium transporter